MTQKRIARKSDILHKLEMGILFDAYYDTETTDLNKRFAEITQFGGVITDLAGNILHTVDLRARVSPYTVISPYAWLVQRMRQDDIDKGDPSAIFMGKVRRFFDYSSKVADAPYKDDFLSACVYGTYTDELGKKIGYYSYPVLNDDGSIDHDFIRIHENLKKFYFKDSRLGLWVKRDMKSMVIGYNNVNADDQWIWTAAHMAGADNVFFTHLAQEGKYRLDMLRVVEAAVVAGQAGENRLVVPTLLNVETGEKAAKFSLGSILAANTRLASELRGIADGIEQSDGSQIDLTQLHGALADALALCALTQYVRKVHPNILYQMERNTDWKYVVDQLSDVRGGFGNNPPVAYVDKNFPAIDGKFVSLIGTDQYRNAPKVTVVWNLAIDPATYTYNGKSLADFSVSDWKDILVHARNNPNGPVKIIRAHKTPRVLDAETGYGAGFNLGLSRTDIHSRSRAVKKARIESKVMAGLRLAYPRLHGADRLELPQPEEELFTFSTLELFDTQNGEDVQVHHRVLNKVEDIAQKSRMHIMRVKELWLKAIFFDEAVFLDPSGNVNDYLKKIKDINKELRKYGVPLLPDADGTVQDRGTALRHKIKILFYARNHFVQGVLKDIGHHFWFEDKDGIRYSDKDVAQWPQHHVDDALRSGNLKIRHEVVNTTPLILDRMIEQLGFAHVLGDDINSQLDAYKQLRRQGIPHQQGIGDRWLTISAARKDLAKIKNNEVMGADLLALEGVIPGAWELFMGKSTDALISLQEYEQYLDSLVIKPWADAALCCVGIDSDSQYPMRNFEYGIERDKSLTVDVPDRYLEKPSLDPVRQRPLWVLPMTEQFNQKSLNGHRHLLLRGAGLRKIFHLANAKVVPLPQRAGQYTDFYKQVANAYAESGMDLPPKDQLMAVIGNGPYPVHELRGKSHITQSLQMPSEHFEAMLSPSLRGYTVAPRGIILRDDHLAAQKGRTTIREKANGVETGWEMDVNIIDVRKIGLADIQSMRVEDIAMYGFPSREQAIDNFSSLFTAQKRNPKNPQNTAWAIAFGNIDPDSPETGIMYHKPDGQMMSCIQKKPILEGPH